MIYFAAPQYLLLLLLVPFFFMFLFLLKRNRRKKMEALGDIALVEKLMPLRSRYKGWVRMVFFSLAWVFFAIGLSRPQMGAKLVENEHKGSEIIIALDVSNSMLAQDYSPNRLERAKLAISRLVDKLRGDRIGLVIFAGRSFVQLPITSDYVSAKIFLNSIDPGSIPDQGTDLAEAINMSMRSFSAQGQMGSDNKAIILITDGENHEADPVIAATNAAEEGIRVFCIGVGTPEGKPIPIGDNGELLRDRDGNIVVTKFDESTLQEVAAAGNGSYVRAGATEFGLNPILDELEELKAQQYESQVFEDYNEQYMYFFGIALVFMLLEFFVGNLKSSRKLFSAALVFMLATSQLSAQTDRSEVRKGNRLFNKDNYKEAEVEYRKGLIKDSLSLASRYNLGNTLYRMDDMEQAQASYTQIADSVAKSNISSINWEEGRVECESTLASDLYHNIGNTFLQQKKYAEAIEAFKNALRCNPGDMDTKSNLAYAQKKLEDEQNQQGGGGGQDQNQDQNQNNEDKDNQEQNSQGQDNEDQNKNDSQDNGNNDSQEQESQNDQDNQNNQDNQDNRDNGNGQTPPKISPNAAEQMIQAMQQKENRTQEKVNREKAKAYTNQREKNW